MTLIVTKASIKVSPWLLDDAIEAVSQDADFLRSSYPGFDQWFKTKVIPGIYLGERTVVVEFRESKVAGVLILKHDEVERKLCTLRVRPHYESRGLGVRLFHTAFEMLGTERPLLSISQLSFPKFERLFRHFGFSKEAVYEGLYTPTVDEFAYNGVLVNLPTAETHDFASPSICFLGSSAHSPSVIPTKAGQVRMGQDYDLDLRREWSLRSTLSCGEA